MTLHVVMQEMNTNLPVMLGEPQQSQDIYDSPHFTGIPIAPTAPVNNSTTQIATTQFVVNQIANTLYDYGNIVTLNISEVTS